MATSGGLLAAPVLKQTFYQLRLPTLAGGVHVSRDGNQVERAVAVSGRKAD